MRRDVLRRLLCAMSVAATFNAEAPLNLKTDAMSSVGCAFHALHPYAFSVVIVRHNKSLSSARLWLRSRLQLQTHHVFRIPQNSVTSLRERVRLIRMMLSMMEAHASASLSWYRITALDSIVNVIILMDLRLSRIRSSGF